MGGFISIERRMFDEDIGTDGYVLAVWCTLLARANWKAGKKKLGRQQRIVQRGQCPIGQHELAGALNFSRKCVRRCLEYLEKTGRISTQRTNQGTIVTICNYDFYQTPEENRGQQGARGGDSEGTHGGDSKGPAGVTHYNKGTILTMNKEQGTNNSARPKRTVPVTHADLSLADRWVKRTQDNWPHLKPDKDDYAQAIAKTKKAVGLNDEQMTALYDWCCKDAFWCDQIQSPAGLLKKSKNGLRKVDNILVKVRRACAPYTNAMQWARERDAAAATQQEFAF